MSPPANALDFDSALDTEVVLVRVSSWCSLRPWEAHGGVSRRGTIGGERGVAPVVLRWPRRQTHVGVLQGGAFGPALFDSMPS